MSAPPPTSLVSLRDRREAAIQVLADGFAGDLLTVEQFDERVTKAYAATTLAELETLVADLAPPSSTALVPLTLDPSLKPPAKRLRALFGSLERHGAWVVPDRLGVSATFGSTVIDFREARFTTPIVEIDARVTFGSLEVIVPPHLAVECDGRAIFGSIESRGGGPVANPDRLLLRITGKAVFGSIEVQMRLPGESEHDARKRARRERKALEAVKRAALTGRRPD